MRIIKVNNYEEMSRQAALLLAAQITMKPDSVLGLATGSTPEGMYQLLTEWHQNGCLDFSKVRTVNLDEYKGLPGTDANSYRYFMDVHLFRHINIQAENTYVPDGMAEDPEEECRRYEKIIETFGGIDLQLLGLGHDGHIGFNEPSDHFELETHVVKLADSTIQANARLFDSAEQVPKEAVTMGIRSIMQSRRVLLLISGQDKAKILKQALFGPVTPEVPASILQIHRELTVVADAAALTEIILS